jgi:alginate O-acetyltransferase complex protein AlgI
VLFNSYEFVFGFLPICVIGYRLLGQWYGSSRALWILAASIFFYGWWSPRSIWILLISILINYVAGVIILDYRRRKNLRAARSALLCAIFIDLTALGIFKYTDFIITNINWLAGLSIPEAHIVLPIGISFFTFTQIAYLVDIWREFAPDYTLTRFGLFVSYFPHLIAGPILHHAQMMPQFDRMEDSRVRREDIAAGCLYFVFGLAKKVLIADSFAEYATPIFTAARDGHNILLGTAWLGALAYTFQLYFDFSGYCDMAIGMSRMLGIELPINFNSPYKSRNIIDFWRRWHITLSAFLRDYVYIPLGGNRRGLVRRYLNLMATMLIGGLWHGANWTFVFWGGLHGVYLVINHLSIAYRKRRQLLLDPSRPLLAISQPLTLFFARSMTFVAVVVGWVFFRAETFRAALDLLAGMLGLNGISLPPWTTTVSAPLVRLLGNTNVRFDGIFAGAAIPTSRYAAALLAVGFLLICMPNVSELVTASIASRSTSARHRFMPRIDWPMGLAVGLLFCICMVYLKANSEFLYFQF